MRWYKLGLLFLLSCCFCQLAKASHEYLGGKIEYRFVGNDSIEILFTKYADCDEIGGVFVIDPTNRVSQKLYIATPTDTFIEYFPICNYYISTDLCNDSLAKCLGGGLLLASGTYEYKKTFSLLQFNSCQLTFFWQGENTGTQKNLRPGTNTTGLANTVPYVFAIANYCHEKINHSPIFNNKFPDFIEVGNDIYHNYGITIDHPEDDSIYAELINPLTTNGASLNYAGQWTGSKPINFLGFPNAALSTPAGFHFDNNCATLFFRPVSAYQITHAAVKVSHFIKRKGVAYKVAEVMYEHTIRPVPKNAFGTFFFRPIIINSTGCIQKGDFPIVTCLSNKPPEKVAVTICTDDSTYLSVGRNPDYTYQWELNGNPIAGATNEGIWAKDTGLYRVVVSHKLTNCTKTSHTTRVMFYNGIVPKITYDSTTRYCIGDTVWLERENKNYSYQIWKQNGQAYSIDTALFFPVTETGRYTLDVVSEIGCRVSSLPLNVTLNLPDTSRLFPHIKTNYCGAFTATLYPAFPLNQYNWQNPIQSTADSFAIDSAGKYILTGIDTNNCPIKDSVFIIEHTLPAINIGNDTAACPNFVYAKQLFATANYNPQNAYLWNNSPTDTLNSYLATDTGLYFVQLTDSNTCTATDSIYLKKFNAIALNLGADTGVCYNVAYTNTLVATPTYISTAKYSWNNNPQDTLNTFFVTDTGTYYVAVTDTHQCVYTDTITIIRHPVISIDLGKDTAICFNTTLNKTLTATPANNPNYTYKWDSSTTDTLYFITATKEGLYYVEVSDNFGCANRDSLVIKRFAKNTFTLGKDTVLCNLAQHTLSIPAAYTQVQWSTGESANTITVSTNGSYWVSANDTNQCKTTDSIQITFNQSPLISLPDTSLCEQNFITLEVPDEYDQYMWSNGSSTYFTTVKDTGTLWVRVVNVCGKDTANTWIKGCRYEPPVIYIPSAFSPNGDGINNVFLVYAENLRKFNMKIFSRWGELIFESNDIQTGWDGYYNGKQAPQEVYMYIISTKGKNNKLNTYFGNFTLIR